MPSGFKLLMILSTPFPLRPSTAIHFARHSRLPLEALFPTVASRGRLLSVVPSSKFGFFIRAAEQVHTQALAKEGYSETATSYPGFKDSYSWPEWSKLADHLLDKGYSQSQVTLGDQDDSLLTDKGLPEEFLRAAGACLDFARERPDILRLLTKKYIKAVVENGSPFLFKNGDESVSRMKFFLSGDASTALEHEKAQTIDIMRYLLSYMYKSYSSSNGNQLKDYESVESSVRKLLLELFNFSGTVWRSKLTEPTNTELPLGNEQLSRPPGKSFEMKRGDWICQKCTFMNFARNMNCLECGEARPKKQLTGAEWECPQCDFFNYGRNTSCLRCDHKRPGDVLLSPTTAAGVGHTRSSNFEQIFSVSKQDSQGGSSIRSGSDDTSDSISRSLDRILGRSSTPSGNMSNSGDKNTSALGNFSPSQLQNMAKQKRNPDSVPFVPLPQDMFRKTQESNNGVQQSSDKAVASSPNTSDFIDSLLKTSENSLKSGRSEESSNASLRWSKTAAELENAKDPANVVPDDDFPDIMPIRKGENRFVVSKKKDRSLTSPAYKRRLAMEQANNYNSIPFVPFPPGYFAKKDNQQVTDPTESAAPSDKVEVLPNKQGEQELGISDQGFAGTSSLQSRGKSYGDGFKSEYSGMNLNQNNSNLSYGISTGSSFQTTDRSWDNNRETSNRTQKNSAFEDNASYASPYHTTQADNNLGKYSGYTANSTQQSTNSWNNSSYSSRTPNTSENYDSFSAEYTANSTKPYNNLLNNKSTSYGESIENSSQPPINTWNNSTSFSGSIPNPTQPSSSSWSSGSAQVNNVSVGLPQQSQNPQSSTGKIPSGGYSGKSLEGSCVKEMDPLDMSEEAKAERWFRRAAQIKDISELSQIPDEDFPEIMPMRKGVNRFVVSKRKTPLERRLTSPQYRRNLPIMSSEPEKDADN